ncbi:hypothetical protein ABLB69_00065 [Xenorhabdus khoisanae]|uniref:hypothetical protein n=1 Tax=Xenorhabdus khoisanae TaxID=880157 RepID=UPI0032B8366E
MTWKKVFILLCSNHDAIRKAATASIQRYQVPPSRCFAFRKLPGFLLLDSDPPSFEDCDLNSKLLVFTHGTRYNTVYIEEDDEYNGRQFAKLLISCGLKNIGLVSIKACRSGWGNFLPTFVHYFSINKAKIGWVLGYKGDIFTSENGMHCYTSRLDYHVHSRFHFRIPDFCRVRIVEGNTPVIIPNKRRYNHFTSINLVDFDDD